MNESALSPKKHCYLPAALTFTRLVKTRGFCSIKVPYDVRSFPNCKIAAHGIHSSYYEKQKKKDKHIYDNNRDF
jgi:hypothetical protein